MNYVKKILKIITTFILTKTKCLTYDYFKGEHNARVTRKEDNIIDTTTTPLELRSR